MLSAWDDYPIHQTPMPIAHADSNDSARYEQYWFGAYDRDASTAVGFGLTLSPNLGVVDGAFSVTRDGVQESVFAAGLMEPDRRSMRVGPLAIEVVEPMSVLRITADDERGLGADITFRRITEPVEEPRPIRTQGPLTMSDRTRLIQFGTAEGEMRVGGDRVELDPAQWLSVRDRSWGSRSTHGSAGAPRYAPGLPSTGDAWFVFSVLHFPDECLHAVWHEDRHGNRHGPQGTVLPLDPATGARGPVLTSTVEADIHYVPGTRWPGGGTVLRFGPRGSVDRCIEVEPLVPFQMKGLGYTHPGHAFGAWSGAPSIDRESWTIAELDPRDPTLLHRQSVSRVRRADGVEGVGIFEHRVAGPHVPSGVPEGVEPPP